MHLKKAQICGIICNDFFFFFFMKYLLIIYLTRMNGTRNGTRMNDYKKIYIFFNYIFFMYFFPFIDLGSEL
jgi:hypothetical protein